jgi:multisubunit Na+/H+ antiporter MnhB subunit
MMYGGEKVSKWIIIILFWFALGVFNLFRNGFKNNTVDKFQYFILWIVFLANLINDNLVD